MRCCLCKQRFYLGAATCWAISEGSNILWGEVCPSYIERGPARMQWCLDRKAAFSRVQAMHDEEAAAEGIGDCPTLDEFLIAEAYYATPRFETQVRDGRGIRRGARSGRGVRRTRTAKRIKCAACSKRIRAHEPDLLLEDVCEGGSKPRHYHERCRSAASA